MSWYFVIIHSGAGLSKCRKSHELIVDPGSCLSLPQTGVVTLSKSFRDSGAYFLPYLFRWSWTRWSLGSPPPVKYPMPSMPRAHPHAPSAPISAHDHGRYKMPAIIVSEYAIVCILKNLLVLASTHSPQWPDSVGIEVWGHWHRRREETGSSVCMVPKKHCYLADHQ